MSLQHVPRAVALAAALFFAGCGAEQRGRIVRDASGREVVIPQRVDRVVSLAPNLTELLFDVGCGERVVGVDSNSTFPAKAAALPKVGGLPPSVEKIVALEPDLVFASSAVDQSLVAEALRRAGVSMYVVTTDRLAQIPEAATTISSLCGCGDGSRWSARFHSEMQKQQRKRAAAPAVLFLAWPDPLYVAGHATFADDLLKIAGATNAAAEVRGWPQYATEALIAHPPDVVIFPSRSFTTESLLKRFRGEAVWRELEAVKKNRVVVLDEDLLTRSGPRAALAARALNEVFDGLGYR